MPERQRVDQRPDDDVAALLGLRRVDVVDVQRMVVHGDEAEEVVVGLGHRLGGPVLVDGADLELLEVAPVRMGAAGLAGGLVGLDRRRVVSDIAVVRSLGLAGAGSQSRRLGAGGRCRRRAARCAGLPAGTAGTADTGSAAAASGAGSAGGATAARKAASTGRPQAAASAWAMVERAPKPGGGVPARSAKRRSPTVSAPRAHAGRRVRRRRGEDVRRLRDRGRAHRARRAACSSRIRARSGACEPRGRRLTTATSATSACLRLVARERDGHVVEAGGAGERDAQRGPRPCGTA